MTGGTTHKLRPSPYLLQVTSQTLFFPVRNYPPHTFCSERTLESHNLTVSLHVTPIINFHTTLLCPLTFPSNNTHSWKKCVQYDNIKCLSNLGFLSVIMSTSHSSPHCVGCESSFIEDISLANQHDLQAPQFFRECWR